MMRSDFCNASQRHWKDAEYLFKDSRLPNADQLYGYSAECGLKYLMKGFGMPVDSSGTPQRQEDKTHINKLWDRYEAYLSGSGVAGYVLPVQNPFDTWDINQRYANDADFTPPEVNVHRQGARAVHALVNRAILEGRL